MIRVECDAMRRRVRVREVRVRVRVSELAAREGRHRLGRKRGERESTSGEEGG